MTQLEAVCTGNEPGFTRINDAKEPLLGLELELTARFFDASGFNVFLELSITFS